jgi:hypothetical protein
VFESENVIEAAEPPDATLAVPVEDPVLVHVQTAGCVHCMVTEALVPPAARSESVTGDPLERPPAGVNAIDDLP